MGRKGRESCGSSPLHDRTGEGEILEEDLNEMILGTLLNCTTERTQNAGEFLSQGLLHWDVVGGLEQLENDGEEDLGQGLSFGNLGQVANL